MVYREDLSGRTVLFVLVLTLVVSVVSLGLYLSTLGAVPNQARDMGYLRLEIRNPSEPPPLQQAKDEGKLELRIEAPSVQ